MPIDKVFGTFQHYLGLRLIVALSFCQRQLADVEANVLTSYFAYIKHTRLHLQRTNSLKHHVVPPRRIPHSRSRQCKERELVAQSGFKPFQVAA